MNTGSANDHYKWGWDKEWFCTPQSTNAIFQVSHTSAGACGSLRHESIQAATMLANSSTKPILVAFSGGLDSQVVCLALKEAQVPFTAFTMIWKDANSNVINNDDVNYATKFCSLHNIHQVFREAVITEYLTGFGAQMAEKYCIQYYRTLTHIYLADLYKDTHAVVVGDGNISFNVIDGELVVDFDEYIVQQYYIDNNIEGTAHFFKYTPELILSQIDTAAGIAFLDAYESIYSAYEESSATPFLRWRVFGSFVKPLIYQSSWDGLLHRGKQHGFETFSDREWKKYIHELGGRKFSNGSNVINCSAKEFLDFMRSPKGSTRIWQAK